jgi:transcriptional regulator with PAS, ATPase and Fis domain
LEKVYAQAGRAAASNISVLILGETGAGKEVLARQIHNLSPRAKKAFLAINCACLPEHLIESELFGYEKGAFTGAGATKPGLLESANEGTVFLDEIGELSMAVQARLLRVLETKEVMRVGSVKTRAIDVRFLAATNRNLELESQSGRFRQDLFFRLNGISLTLPPLRERQDEIQPLAMLFLDQFSRELKRSSPGLSPQTLEILRSYAWPGNVRELRNMMERALILCDGDELLPRHLPLDRMRPQPVAPVTFVSLPVPPALAVPPVPVVPDAVKTPTERLASEKARVVEALARCAGNQSRAARFLGISRRTLITRLDNYGIPRPQKETAKGDDDSNPPSDKDEDTE